MIGKVYLNDKGQFLQVFEVSSHSTHKTYGYRWGSLDKATIFKHRDAHPSTYAWKSPSDVPKIIASIRAKEVRTVILIEEEES